MSNSPRRPGAKKTARAKAAAKPGRRPAAADRTRSAQKTSGANAPARSAHAIAAQRDLFTVLDHVRHAVSRLNGSDAVIAHGTSDPVSEAVFLVCEAVHLHPDQFEPFAMARLTADESARVLALIEARVTTRKPSAYLVNKIYMRGLPFYVDERVIVPRSFIGELLETHFGEEQSLIGDPSDVTRVLDLCTGSGCLAILAARHFPNAVVDAVELSPDAAALARRNIDAHGLSAQVRLFQGDLFDALAEDEVYDLIISNPPYVDAQGMADLPQECRHEPAMAFDGGPDGLAIIHRILAQAGRHLTPDGGLLCEIGRGRDVLEAARPDLPFLWLDTEESEGEVFWLPAAVLQGL